MYFHKTQMYMLNKFKQVVAKNRIPFKAHVLYKLIYVIKFFFVKKGRHISNTSNLSTMQDNIKKMFLTKVY